MSVTATYIGNAYPFLQGKRALLRNNAPNKVSGSAVLAQAQNSRVLAQFSDLSLGSDWANNWTGFSFTEFQHDYKHISVKYIGGQFYWDYLTSNTIPYGPFETWIDALEAFQVHVADEKDLVREAELQAEEQASDDMEPNRDAQ